MKASTIKKFEEYYRGNEKGKYPAELTNFIARNWENYQKWSNEKWEKDKTI